MQQEPSDNLNDDILRVCEQYNQKNTPAYEPAKATDLWIQALTYFRDLEDQNKAEDYIGRVLTDLSADRHEEIISPHVVLEILQRKPTLKFRVMKKYLLERLRNKDRELRQNKRDVETNLEDIKKKRKEISDIKTLKKTFSKKTCDQCSKLLTLPSIHFMCGHSYHDECIKTLDDGRRTCQACFDQFECLFQKKEDEE